MSSRKWKPILYGCGKCGHQVSEGAVNDHIAKCQPKGAECGKCKKLITDKDFVSHFRSCEGSSIKKVNTFLRPISEQVKEKNIVEGGNNVKIKVKPI